MNLVALANRIKELEAILEQIKKTYPEATNQSSELIQKIERLKGLLRFHETN